MRHYGDITKINGAEIEPVWCITGGSPCQDLSIAGKREGLAGERSGLFMEMVRVIKEMREGDIKRGRTDKYIRPRFVIWENVAGAFTSNRGEDFRAVRTLRKSITYRREPAREYYAEQKRGGRRYPKC